MTGVPHMLGERVERLVLRINRDLDVLRDRHPLALRAEITATITTTITISKASRTSWTRAVTTVATRRTSGAIAAITTWRASRTITTRTCATATAETTFATTTGSATISTKATATAVTAITTLRTIFAIAKALDDFLFLAEVTNPRGHHAQAGQIEEIGLGGFGGAGFGFAHKS
jgi:hypothetical protein